MTLYNGVEPFLHKTVCCCCCGGRTWRLWFYTACDFPTSSYSHHRLLFLCFSSPSAVVWLCFGMVLFCAARRRAWRGMALCLLLIWTSPPTLTTSHCTFPGLLPPYCVLRQTFFCPLCMPTWFSSLCILCMCGLVLALCLSIPTVCVPACSGFRHGPMNLLCVLHHNIWKTPGELLSSVSNMSLLYDIARERTETGTGRRKEGEEQEQNLCMKPPTFRLCNSVC